MTKTRPHLAIYLRNGVGLDISSVPTESGIGYHEDGSASLLTTYVLQLLVPFVAIRVGVYVFDTLTTDELIKLEKALDEEINNGDY